MLPPGAYTAEVGGANGLSGTALIEVFEVPEPKVGARPVPIRLVRVRQRALELIRPCYRERRIRSYLDRQPVDKPAQWSRSQSAAVSPLNADFRASD